ncbi:alpha/beta fold hydrolase [Brevibacillus migulae]|uniref:alpha/beta fold hydrolase n=1 Tax=Brevibacillus migulae TaxID=1644114 RepID=UPI00106EF307|nr:alpha/beta hydrolase [Brevibacillus migulae]
MTYKEKHFIHKGHKTAYLDAGSAERPVLLLLHSIRGTKSFFDLIRDAFLPHYRVLIPDLRGHGVSDKEAPFTFQQIAEDLRELLRHEKVQKVSIIASSFSCVPAQMLAAEEPALIQALILLDGGFYSLGNLPGFDYQAQVERFANTRFHSLEEVHRAFSRHHPGTVLPAHIAESEMVWDPAGYYRYKLPVEALSAYFQDYMAFQPELVLSSIRCPVLLLHADEKLAPTEEHRAFIRSSLQAYLGLAPQARAIRIAGGRHLLMLQSPLETSRLSLSFLRKL